MTKRGFGQLTVILVSSLFISALIGLPLARAQIAADKQLVFELLNRIEQLEQEVRQLRGDLEVYRHSQENLTRRLEALESGGKSSDTAANLREPRGRTGIPPEPLGPSPTPPAEAKAPPAGTNSSPRPPTAPPVAPAAEQTAYDTALSMLREGRLEQSIAGFQEFLRNYPDGPLAGNAQYWLGEAYYVTRDFDNAKEAFVNLGVNYPNNEKIPDALLKLGNIYQELGEKARAREVLQKLVEAYPDSQAAGLAQKRLQSLR
jgi:tol-pal system protein YbgF